MLLRCARAAHQYLRTGRSLDDPEKSRPRPARRGLEGHRHHTACLGRQAGATRGCSPKSRGPFPGGNPRHPEAPKPAGEPSLPLPIPGHSRPCRTTATCTSNCFLRTISAHAIKPSAFPRLECSQIGDRTLSYHVIQVVAHTSEHVLHTTVSGSAAGRDPLRSKRSRQPVEKKPLTKYGVPQATQRLKPREE